MDREVKEVLEDSYVLLYFAKNLISDDRGEGLLKAFLAHLSAKVKENRQNPKKMIEHSFKGVKMLTFGIIKVAIQVKVLAETNLEIGEVIYKCFQE